MDCGRKPEDYFSNASGTIFDLALGRVSLGRDPADVRDPFHVGPCVESHQYRYAGCGTILGLFGVRVARANRHGGQDKIKRQASHEWFLTKASTAPALGAATCG
jgi:hypothetical protein